MKKDKWDIEEAIRREEQKWMKEGRKDVSNQRKEERKSKRK
jgi:hypothetical protein